MPKLFSGLKFYFYPPKFIHSLSKTKSAICSRHGATVQAEADHETTHVIVALAHATPVFWRLVQSKPLKTDCCIVNDQWPSDCVQQKQLLAPTDYLVDFFANKESIELTKPVKRVKLVPQAHREPAICNLKAPDMSNPLPPAHESAPPHSGLLINQRLISVFRDLVQSRESNGEEFSARTYRQALKRIENSSVTITSGEHAQHLFNLSPKMNKLIDDVLTGQLPASIAKLPSKRTEVVQLFASVYGIGKYTAQKLYNAGHRTLADIRPIVDENSQVSIDHHADFVERMSRLEVSKHFAAVQQILYELDPDAQALCMGSYRRNQLDCGDIDIILTKPDTKLRDLTKIFANLCEKMFACSLAVYTFSLGTDRWLGATKVINRWRRMDILLVPWAELGAADIYYTGNDLFNRRLRYMAKQRGMRLNQNGLFRRDLSGKLVLLESHSERRIMEILGQPYLPPDQRNIT